MLNLLFASCIFFMNKTVSPCKKIEMVHVFDTHVFLLFPYSGAAVYFP